MYSAIIFKPMRQLIVLFFFIVTSTSAYSAHYHYHRPKTEAISGQIVAYSGGLFCTNGHAEWSMIIRVQPYKHIPSKLIRVEFSYPCDKSPDGVWAQSQVKKFRLYRQQECDTALERQLPADDKQKSMDFKISDKDESLTLIPIPIIWRYPPGIEPFTLPFGQVLPCYYSLDLPYRPVL